jgi:hypothetical protein
MYYGSLCYLFIKLQFACHIFVTVLNICNLRVLGFSTLPAVWCYKLKNIFRKPDMFPSSGKGLGDPNAVCFRRNIFSRWKLSMLGLFSTEICSCTQVLLVQLAAVTFARYSIAYFITLFCILTRTYALSLPI